MSAAPTTSELPEPLARHSFAASGGSGARSKFKTIVADPPWIYAMSRGTDMADYKSPDGCDRRKSNKARKMPYSMMSVEEIKALPVAELADENCELYLWTTQKYLPEAFGVAEAWGFRYCGTLTWCKPPRGNKMGGLYCPTTEFLVHARRGKMPQGKTRQDSTWWNVKRPHNSHSSKPENFTDMIEAMSDAPRLEMFARRQRLGWQTWGNEALNHVELVLPNQALDGRTERQA
jgi:N6-adenosine-specific RNA methylase IME4